MVKMLSIGFEVQQSMLARLVVVGCTVGITDTKKIMKRFRKNFSSQSNVFLLWKVICDVQIKKQS